MLKLDAFAHEACVTASRVSVLRMIQISPTSSHVTALSTDHGMYAIVWYITGNLMCQVHVHSVLYGSLRDQYMGHLRYRLRKNVWKSEEAPQGRSNLIFC